MDLHSAYAKHEQRVVLVFSEPLASGAFGVSPTLYDIENLDGRSVKPTVRAALLVPGDANVVELTLAYPMSNGSQFQVTATAVPAFAGGTATGIVSFEYATATLKKNQEPAATPADILIYGSDLSWNGFDFQETATGDLESVDGAATVSKALERRCKSGPLAWDDTYGARARNYVDSPVGASGTLRGTLAAQCSRDPRVSSVQVRAFVDQTTSAFEITPTLVSGAPVEPVTIKVQNG